MRVVVVLALLLLLGFESRAHAQPLRVTIQCENTGRTKACPAFLLGFVDAHPVLLQVPRANAEVMVYVNATEVALIDQLHLRFVGNVPGAPRVIELDVDLDTRADDDTQRAQLEPAFLRGMALYVGARFPRIVTTQFGTPEGEEVKPKDTSPWDVAFELGGWGNKSGAYESANGWSSLGFARVERRHRLGASVWANGGVNRQPPLRLEDGTEVSVNARNYNYGAQAKGAWLYNHCYSLGLSTSTWRDDPQGQYQYGWDAKLGFEWDRYRADDPRGNRLAIAYVLGYQVDRYNLRNELGERFAQYPTHRLIASGRLRKDRISVGMWVSVGGELLRPDRRHNISASPNLTVQLGARVDLNLSFSITKRELPAPDASEIDPDDFQQLSRLAYAEPLAMNGSFNIRIHWDRTNGARNDRLDEM